MENNPDEIFGKLGNFEVKENFGSYTVWVRGNYDGTVVKIGTAFVTP
jgi:hypothetical protein